MDYDKMLIDAIKNAGVKDLVAIDALVRCIRVEMNRNMVVFYQP
jgi:hypothetical protein